MATAPDSDVVPLCREWIRITFRFYVSDPAALSRMRGDYCAGTPAAIRHQNRAMDIVDASFKDFDFRPELRTTEDSQHLSWRVLRPECRWMRRRSGPA